MGKLLYWASLTAYLRCYGERCIFALGKAPFGVEPIF